MSDERPDDTTDSEYLGEADPITGIPEGGGDPEPQLPDSEPGELETDDAVAGETVDPGTGERGENDGPTGGAPGEVEPDLPENDLAGEEIRGLDDE